MIQSLAIRRSSLIEFMALILRIWNGHPRDTKLCNQRDGYVENQRRHHDSKYGINAWSLNT